MIVAISAAGRSLDSRIDPRFGRCPYLLFVDSESMDFEAVENPGAVTAGGAGVQAAELVAKKGAKAVITGECGPNARQVLSAAGIDVFPGAFGSAREAVERHGRGNPRTAPGPLLWSGEPTGENELAFLKREAEAVKDFLGGLERRIDELEKKAD